MAAATTLSWFSNDYDFAPWIMIDCQYLCSHYQNLSYQDLFCPRLWGLHFSGSSSMNRWLEIELLSCKTIQDSVGWLMLCFCWKIRPLALHLCSTLHFTSECGYVRADLKVSVGNCQTMVLYEIFIRLLFLWWKCGKSALSPGNRRGSGSLHEVLEESSKNQNDLE